MNNKTACKIEIMLIDFCMMLTLPAGIAVFMAWSYPANLFSLLYVLFPILYFPFRRSKILKVLQEGKFFYCKLPPPGAFWAILDVIMFLFLGFYVITKIAKGIFRGYQIDSLIDFHIAIITLCGGIITVLERLRQEKQAECAEANHSDSEIKISE